MNRVYNRNKFFLHAIHLQGFALISWTLQLLLELLFRILTLRPGIVLSFIDFIKKIPEVRQSRCSLRNLQSGKKLAAVQDVFLQIVSQLPADKITIFKR